ncbi:TetR/AcrR family transcriptional regulator [Oryzifoliimicrobium ureilyticus]|uniref:TetR/AcrR family transcriptional regulator n=1 Tax=Oryzifoliimicrobium ureilyticus TaxID=3113724 RepID=UPI003075F53D
MSRTLSVKLSPSENSCASASTKVPPRERIVSTACELFREHGIKGIGVDAIADAADTNKMTLYRHFGSKDELICETLRRASENADAIWSDLESQFPGEPAKQLAYWVEKLADCLKSERAACDLANAAIELKDENHPAHALIAGHKAAQRNRLAELCRRAGVRSPDQLADTLALLVEGARVTRQATGAINCSQQFMTACNAAISSFS